MKKEPIITLSVTPGGVCVTVDNTEELRPDQKDGFNTLSHEVRLFAQGLFSRAAKIVQTPPAWN